MNHIAPGDFLSNILLIQRQTQIRLAKPLVLASMPPDERESNLFLAFYFPLFISPKPRKKRARIMTDFLRVSKKAVETRENCNRKSRLNSKQCYFTKYRNIL